MIENEQGSPSQSTQDARPRCPVCAALSRLTHSLLDARTGKIVHLYSCGKCGEPIWGD